GTRTDVEADHGPRAPPPIAATYRRRESPSITAAQDTTIGTMRGTQIMLSEADRRKAADILMSAEKERKQAVQLTKTWPDITIEDAYAISTEAAKRKIAGGAKLIGHKVGLTSKAMQRS